MSFLRDSGKDILRKRILEVRDSMDPVLRRSKDEKIRMKILNLREFINSTGVMLFASFRSEVNTLRLMEDILYLKKRLFLPKVNPVMKGLEVYEVTSLESLEPGHMGIPEPSITCRVADIHDIDLIIAPGVVFDRRGGRIGYGRGYYDKLLRDFKKRILIMGIAYDEQVVDLVPMEEHDVYMDIIVTDREVYYGY